ncbi:MAG: DMT family transporter [Candidatus Nanopelagicales bacterium]
MTGRSSAPPWSGDRPAIRLPGTRDAVLLAVAVAAVSTSAPMIAACTAPALAIAFWRSLLGAGVTAPFVMVGGLAQFRGLGRRQWVLLIAAGVFLALHFATWIPSIRFTSVASAAALVATQPVWAALIARMRGVHVAPGVWVGIVVSLIGVIVLTGIDFHLDPRSLVGDALALVGAALAAAYVTTGEQVRQSLNTVNYTTVAYAVSAGVLLPICLVFGAELSGYSARDWLLILGLTAIAQLLGHTLVNVVLQSTSATVVSLAILFELPGAIIVAGLFLGQVPPPQILPALVLLAAGLVVVVRASRADEPLESPPV